MFGTTREIRSIKGLSERRRLPRLGKIRLGIRKKGASGDYPAEVDYFVCPPEVQRVYGATPKALRILIPVDDTTVVFPQAYKWYGKGAGLKCKGDGDIAIRRWADVEPQLQAKITGTYLPNDLVEIPCPCPRLQSGECGVKAHLMVLLPEVSLSGIYQIDTGSVMNLIEINSSLDFLRGLLGRVAMVPLTLRREPRELSADGKRRTHYILKLTFDGDLHAVRLIRENGARLAIPALAMPRPSDEGPGLAEAHRPSPQDAAATLAERPPDAPTAAPETAGPPSSAPAVLTPPDQRPAAEGDSATPAAGSPQKPPAAATTPGAAGSTPPQPGQSTAATASGPKWQCTCGKAVTERVAEYSVKYFGEVMCMDCQKRRYGVKSKR